jgi:hypothetical protein
MTFVILVPMEGVTVTVSAGKHPVNISKVYQDLLAIAKEHELLNEKVTNFLSLECLTIDLIREAYSSQRHYMELVSDLLELWFTSLYTGLQESGESWSHYWDLDLEVEVILGKAGYPINDDEISTKDLEDIPALANSDDED